MIKRKKKECKECGNERYIYGRGLCNYCYAKDYKERQIKKEKERIEKSKPKKKSSYISSVSDTNTFEDSDGNRWNKKQIDNKISEAKAEKHYNTLDKHGYIVCEDCGRNDCKPVDISHTISVDEAQNSSRVELAWDVRNMRHRGRKCHMKHDKLPKEVREQILKKDLER